VSLFSPGIHLLNEAPEVQEVGEVGEVGVLYVHAPGAHRLLSGVVLPPPSGPISSSFPIARCYS